MNKRGFTLVEVLIVITISAVLLTIATLSYRSMKNKSDQERQTRELHADISDIRLNAMQKKLRSALFLGPQQSIYRTYSSENESISDGKEISRTNYRFELRKKSGSSLNGLNIATDRIEFDSRGFTNISTTLVVMPVTFSGGLDCIAVQTARTSIGRMENASNCRKQ